MRVGGYQKFSLIDYPGKCAAVVFSQGCCFRCRYCYNPELVYPELFNSINLEEKVLAFLNERKDYLDGVVVSGGEPTDQKDLIPFLDKLKRMGYTIKLDTNGSRPRIIDKVIQLRLVNFIAMDIKAPLDKYREVIGVPYSVERIKESIDIIQNAGIGYQFRTTLVKPLCSYGDVARILGMINDPRHFVLQQFVPSGKILDKDLLYENHYAEDEFERMKAGVGKVTRRRVKKSQTQSSAVV